VHISKALIAASLALAIVSVPIPALAGGRQFGGHHHGGGRHHVSPHRGIHRPVYGFGMYAPYYGFRYPYYGRFYGGGYGYFGGSYGSTTYYAPPTDYPSSMIYAPTIVYPSAPSYGYPGSYSSVAVAPAPSRPSVVEHATGRYELRGDGVSMPYTWVWIPNPPPPPEVEPQAAPEPAPPASQSAPPPRASADRAPRKSQLYRWVDAQGVVHLTDNPENVPEAQRTQARRPF
jgi:hypothetical protein